MNKFIGNLSRRNVVKASISYLVIGWVVLQVADILFPAFGIPEEALKYILYVELILFPFWTIFAYVYEWTPEGFKRTDDVEEEKSEYSKTSNRLNYFIIGGLSLAIVLLVADRVFNFTNITLQDNSQKSIAVLPFTNLSADADQEYFSDGLTEDILTQLAKIERFKVISKTSIMQYKTNRPSLTQIAEELNVGLLMEGSVQKAGDELRINVQLIDVSEDKNIWAQSYDRSVADLFKIQREVAISIAEILKTQLSPEEAKQLDAVPTDNIAAYQLYQQGKYYLDQAHFNIDYWLKAVAYFNDATVLDPNFAEAYGQLSKANSRIYYLRRDYTDERLAFAKRAADKALSLDPGNPKVQLDLGYYHLWCKSDKKTALSYFEEASKGLPNSVPVLKAKASIYEAQGAFDKYIEAYEQATNISPRDASCWTNLTFGYQFTYQFKKGLESTAKAIVLDPEEAWNHLSDVHIYFAYEGASEKSRAALNRVDKDHAWYLWTLFHQEMFEENFEELLEIIESHPEGAKHKITRIPQPLMKAYILDYLGREKEAQVQYARAVDMMEKEILSHDDDDRYNSALGLSYAGIGQKEKAIKYGKRAMELMPLSKDALYGQAPILDLALIYAMTDEPDLSFDLLEGIFSKASWWTTKYMEKDVRYAALRNHPRFDELIKKYNKQFQ